MSDWLSRRRFIGTSAACAAFSPFVAAAKAQKQSAAKGKKSAAAPKKSPAAKGMTAAEARALYEDAQGRATATVWCRRVHLDLAGRIPTAAEARAFAAASASDKRARLVDALLASEDFADYWAMRYCDILRVKSEFPINLWPNAVYVYHRRIRESVAHDESWLAFARALLTTAGSNFRDPEANFLRATAKRTAEGLSEVASLTFLGEATTEYAAYFAPVAIKTTREWKEEIVYFNPGHPNPVDFADRLAGDLKDRFSAAHAQRVWQWIFCEPPDAARAKTLAAAFAQGGFRLKPFLRRLVLSDDYARGSVTGGFPIRRLDAEVLDDAICALTGAKRDYQSIAPEPFTFLPPERKSVLIEDGSIASAFLILFGRPARDSGLFAERHNDVTTKQRLYLFNSGKLYARLGSLAERKSFRSRPFRDLVDEFYWRILGRAPAPFEVDALQAYRKKVEAKVPRERRHLPKDVCWCLINSKEFLFRI